MHAYFGVTSTEGSGASLLSRHAADFSDAGLGGGGAESRQPRPETNARRSPSQPFQSVPRTPTASEVHVYTLISPLTSGALGKASHSQKTTSHPPPRKKTPFSQVPYLPYEDRSLENQAEAVAAGAGATARVVTMATGPPRPSVARSGP